MLYIHTQRRGVLIRRRNGFIHIADFSALLKHLKGLMM
jgi:hypothetical protein